RLLSHPFMRALAAGAASEATLKLFIQNWYTFALEVNTAASTVYHRFISFYKTHPVMEDLLTATIAEEFSRPGPGGHIRIMQRVGEAAGLTREELAAAQLIPGARAWVDFQVRLLTEGTLAEVAADFICEGEFGHFAKVFFEALTKQYDFTASSSQYFQDHFEADAKGKASNAVPVLSHGERGKALLVTLLEEGLVEERTGWGLDYTIFITVAMFELLLDGINRGAGDRVGLTMAARNE
ncbi:MAG: iron-containing redox enzyme family protein, partial [Pyrinomonadaceae bacterium]